MSRNTCQFITESKIMDFLMEKIRSGLSKKKVLFPTPIDVKGYEDRKFLGVFRSLFMILSTKCFKAIDTHHSDVQVFHTCFSQFIFIRET